MMPFTKEEDEEQEKLELELEKSSTETELKEKEILKKHEYKGTIYMCPECGNLVSYLNVNIDYPEHSQCSSCLSKLNKSLED
jgi:rubrerythrin